MFHPLALVRARRYKEAITDPENPVSWGLLKLWRFDGSLTGTQGETPLSGAVATLRPDGRFGGCVAVEVGTTNLCPNPSFETDTAGWINQFGSGGFERDTSQSYHGTASAKCICMDSSVSGRAYFTVPLKAGECLTLSGYALAFESESVYVRVEYHGGDYYWKKFEKGEHSGSGQWERLTSTGEFATSDCTAYCYICNLSQTTAAYWDAIQSEKLPYATSFTTGTRAAGVLKYDPSILNKTHGTIAVWFKLHNLNTRYNALITTSTAASPGPRLLIMREFEGVSANKLRVWDGDGSTEDVLTSTTVLQKDVWYHFAFTWSPSGRRLYINGSLEASNARSGPIGGSELRIGYWVLDSELLNGLIDEVMLWNQDADRLAKRYLRRMEMLGWYIPPNPTP